VRTNTDKGEVPTVAKFGLDTILVKTIDARKRLQEARYFLNKMKDLETQGLTDEFIYHLDGFLVAWHSIIDDTILYDYTEQLKLPFTRRDKMTRDDFEFVARVLDNRGEQGASKFLTYLKSGIDELRKNYLILWQSRNVGVHTGLVNIGTKMMTKKVFYFGDDPQQLGVIDVCELAYRDMDKLLTNAQIKWINSG
jgi:hypothetical protein